MKLINKHYLVILLHDLMDLRNPYFGVCISRSDEFFNGCHTVCRCYIGMFGQNYPRKRITQSIIEETINPNYLFFYVQCDINVLEIIEEVINVVIRRYRLEHEDIKVISYYEV